MKNNNILKLIIGILISVGFLYFAFGRIDFGKMKDAFSQANYWYLVPAFIIMLFSHWLRACRLQYFIQTTKKLSVFQLFSATMIGYAGNAVLPAHLGEVIRANVIGNKYEIPTTTIIASLLVERLIDTLTMLLIMVFTLIVYPFPKWATNSGYILLAVTIVGFIVLYLLKIKEKRTYALMRICLSILPGKVSTKIEELIDTFVDGIGGLRRKRDFFYILIYSILIWGSYWLIFNCVYFAFDIYSTYDAGIVSSVVLLVITTVSVIVPSSPGYIGTYHLLCQMSLKMFGVPESVGLSFAFIAHAISTLGAAAVGAVFAWKEGVSRFRKTRTREDDNTRVGEADTIGQ